MSIPCIGILRFPGLQSRKLRRRIRDCPRNWRASYHVQGRSPGLSRALVVADSKECSSQILRFRRETRKSGIHTSVSGVMSFQALRPFLFPNVPDPDRYQFAFCNSSDVSAFTIFQCCIPISRRCVASRYSVDCEKHN